MRLTTMNLSSAYLRATSHTRLRAHDHYTSSTLIGGKGGAGQVHFTLHLRDQQSMWMQDGCKVYMDSYMASNGSHFMVTWTILKNHLLEVGLTQNQKTMAFWTLRTVDLFYFNLCEDPHESKFIEIAFGWGPHHIRLHTTLEGPWPHYMILEVSWESLWTLRLSYHNFMLTTLGSYVKWPWGLGWPTNPSMTS